MRLSPRDVGVILVKAGAEAMGPQTGGVGAALYTSPRMRFVLVGLLLLASVASSAAKAPRARHAPSVRRLLKATRGAPGASAAEVARLGRGYRLFVGADYAAAQEELTPLAASKLRNRDLALYLLAESEALTGATAAGLGHFLQVAAMQQSRMAAPAKARAADLAFDLGRYREAKAGYTAAQKSVGPSVDAAVIHFRLARIEELTARAPTAATKRRLAELYKRVYIEYPAHPLAERALGRMKEVDPSLAIADRDRVTRARLLTAARQWQRALDELARVPADAPPEVRDEADYWIGTTHFKMRHGYDVAAAMLLAVAPRLSGDRKLEALFHGARAFSRDDQDDRAVAGYRDLVARFPHARQAPEASFLVGWLDYNRGRYQEAQPSFEETLKRYGSSAFGDDARWYLGLSRWFAGDVPGALLDFSRCALRGGALDGGKGRYWKGRALDRLGRAPEAVTVWRQLVTDFPLTYYALLARTRLRERGVEVGAMGDAEKRPVSALGAVDEALAEDPAIAAADELLAAGLGVEAGVVLDAGDGALIQKYGAARAVPILLDRYIRAENFHRVHRLAEAHSGGALQRDPHTQPAALGWWKHVYPLAWRALVEKHGPSGSNPPYYLYTIMQKESAYNPHDVSYADAIGLLQMIPPTSRRVAERIGRTYTDDLLYDPDGNIQFGAWYIGHLLEKFKGQIPIGAGSYNAGPKAMMRWLKKSGDRPLDEFIELCAYTQTREYMKKALDIYARYLYLYGQQDFFPAAAVDAKYLENDLDY
ncbi:MAG: tetratricopeptide repeat protein [Myxococcales bacterium]|nr:tetratricopeptide repeat protein [Myxococcales bacterium]